VISAARSEKSCSRRIAGENVVRSRRAYHLKAAVPWIDPALAHGGPERGIRFRVGLMDEAPTDIQPVQGIPGQRAVRVSHRNGSFFKEKAEKRGSHEGTLSLMCNIPSAGCNGIPKALHTTSRPPNFPTCEGRHLKG
jgi:hypothetical protein